MSGLGERFSEWGYAAGWKLVRALPERTATRLFDMGADRAANRGGAGVQQLRRNLARVVPQAGEEELDDLVRQSLRSYARYWREAFRLPGMDHEAIHEAVGGMIAGIEYVDAALAKGNGAILALTHSGNWDIAGVFLVHHCGRFTTVVERLKPESLYKRFVAYRESLGFEVLPATGGRVPPGTVLTERLKQNKVVALVADRDLTPSGIPVTLFDHATRMPAGPAKLAAATGAALLPVGCWFTDDGGWGFRVHPPIRVNSTDDVPAATQSLADSFAADIAAHPADWHMLQKLWLQDLPEGRRKVLTKSDPG
jgi:phosphatidylinositol dimannoside acyltransferase